MVQGPPTRTTRTRAGIAAALFWLGASGAALAQDTAPRVDWGTLRISASHASALDTSGASRELTLDLELQEAARLLLTRARALASAATIVDVATGRVLAAAEVGDLSGGSLLFDPVAPAASVFKLVTTIALYEHTGVTPTTRVCTKGGIRSLDEEHLSAPRGAGVVCNPFAHALGASRNAAYAQLASQMLEPEALRATAERLGFNRPRSSDAPGQLGSLAVPDGGLAYARTAAGFENSRLSVLGGAELGLAVASGGWGRPLRLFAEREGALPFAAERSPRLFSGRSAERVRRAMEFTVHSGTAHDAFLDESGKPYLGAVRVAGKTGTRRPSAGAPTASWFIGFAPSDRPRVVVSVLLQNSELWHQKGAQVARDLLRVYFGRLGAPGVSSPLERSGGEALRTASRRD